MINKDKRILITGANGFVGANLTRKLVDLGFKNIYIIIRKESNLWRIDDIKDKLNIDYISITDENELSQYINKIKPEIIYHLAAAGAYIGRDYRGTKDLFEFNVLGTINLINACSEIGFDYFVNTGSNSEYGQKDFAMKETDLLEPNNEYGITKASATLYASHIGKKLSLPIYTFRLFAVFGPYEDKSRLIPSIMLKYINNESPSLSKPDSVRDFIFIDDVIEYYLNIDKVKGDFGGIFNIGDGEQNSIDEIVKLVKNISKFDLKPIYGNENLKQNEPRIWKSDNSKAKKVFNLNHNSKEEGFKKTYEWFNKNFYLYN